ncbi:hypothetical protein CsatA_000976 [Cannabis sativa]
MKEEKYGKACDRCEGIDNGEACCRDDLRNIWSSNWLFLIFYFLYLNPIILQDNIFREAQTMTLVENPNVLKFYYSFVNGQFLWVVMPFMAGGSCLHILKVAHLNGFDEVVIATILREILNGLAYIYIFMGATYIKMSKLVGAHGAIKLGDFDVFACLYVSGDRQHVRNTFVDRVFFKIGGNYIIQAMAV